MSKGNILCVDSYTRKLMNYAITFEEESRIVSLSLYHAEHLPVISNSIQENYYYIKKLMALPPIYINSEISILIMNEVYHIKITTEMELYWIFIISQFIYISKKHEIKLRNKSKLLNIEVKNNRLMLTDTFIASVGQWCIKNRVLLSQHPLPFIDI